MLICALMFQYACKLCVSPLLVTHVGVPLPGAYCCGRGGPPGGGKPGWKPPGGGKKPGGGRICRHTYALLVKDCKISR